MIDRTYETVLADILAKQQHHLHGPLEMATCCTIGNGGIPDPVLVAAHTKRAVGWNGRKLCDSYDGPCSCGAWHRKGSRPKLFGIPFPFEGFSLARIQLANSHRK